ncbi:MAG: EscU/YscU/HrcU family type III secretion system export apparatus switch protein [Pseudorhodobacter sp.]|nr:EscU/YscU/HrcU family type III secretion system export apparatus switch protein [Frankiaceae bacterium]
MSGDKTEKATPKKLKDLRKKGVVARSVELPSGVSLLALVLVLPGMVSRLLDVLRTDMTVVFSSADVTDVTQAKGLAGRVLLDSVRSIAPSVAIVGGAAIVAGSLVTRSRPNPAAIKPKMERLNPGKAIKRMLSPHSVNELVKNVAKLSALGLVAVGSWKTGSKELLASGGSSEAMQAIVGATVRSMLWRVAVLALLVGVADAAWQRRSFGKQSRMSKQDVSDENKQSEGNPHTKGQMRQRMLSNSRSRMIQAVPKADVVLANPTHLVVALAYAPGSAAPVVVAKGAGATADRIKALAAEHGIPVLVHKPLARAIYRGAEVGDGIPVELFRAVAEVLAVVYAAKRRGTRPSWKPIAA